MRIYKYQGAGNDFLIIDGRNGNSGVTPEKIVRLCDRRYGIGADGFMILKDSPTADFAMDFYNSDGSSGMMCGNGGRCIVAFAHRCGFRSFRFEAPDGIHRAEVLHADDSAAEIRLQMIDVEKVERPDPDAYFLNTGTVHYVTFKDNVETTDVCGEGRGIRHDRRFAPVGTNVNFVQRVKGGIKIRTFEKGVEDETFACGTGIVASSIATYCRERMELQETFSAIEEDGRVKLEVQARRDRLKVDFRVERQPDGRPAFRDIYLTGPAVSVFSTEISL